MTVELPARNLLYGESEIFKTVITRGDMFGNLEFFNQNKKRRNSARVISENAEIYSTTVKKFDRFLKKYNLANEMFVKRTKIMEEFQDMQC